MATAFDDWVIASDFAALLLHEIDCAIQLKKGTATCFIAARGPRLVEHAGATTALQRKSAQSRRESRPSQARPSDAYQPHPRRYP